MKKVFIAKQKNCFIGTSGYTYNHWKKRFYPQGMPQKEWFKYYWGYFKTVEINASFYHSLKKETYEKWKKETPKDFKFFIKGHRFITGIKRLKDVDKYVKFFFEGVLTLKEKLAGILWQFPPGFKFNEETGKRLDHFLKILPKKIKHAFEFRDGSWFTNPIYKTLASNNAALVIADSRRSLPQGEITADFIYIRFHGPAALYSSLYSERAIRDWADKIKKWRKKYDVYIYFNNDANANAVKNAKQLIKLL